MDTFFSLQQNYLLFSMVVGSIPLLCRLSLYYTNSYFTFMLRIMNNINYLFREDREYTRWHKNFNIKKLWAKSRKYDCTFVFDAYSICKEITTPLTNNLNEKYSRKLGRILMFNGNFCFNCWFKIIRMQINMLNLLPSIMYCFL